MSLDFFQDMIAQFDEISFQKSGYYVIGGGEAMAPYIFGNNDYIRRALSTIHNIHGIPTIKTNAKWGEDKSLRQFVLKDLADAAYESQVVTTLDISIDEFHNNIVGAANVISDVIKSHYLAPAIRIFLVGFNTQASQKQLDNLINKLNKNKIQTMSANDGTNYDFAAFFGDYGIKIFTSFNTPIYCAGRAISTKTYTTKSNTGMPDSDGHCLSIDNDDFATLNYKFRERIAGRKLETVIQSLMNKVYRFR